jgi:glycerol-3-phosphate dehydrogenase
LLAHRTRTSSRRPTRASCSRSCRSATLISTTDVDYDGELGAPVIDEAERRYLLEMANRYRALSRRP